MPKKAKNMPNLPFILSDTSNAAHLFLAQMRDVDRQKNRLLFRKNIERIGWILGYEISKTLKYRNTKTTTPLGDASTLDLHHQPVIATVLRAGIPLQQGLAEIFDAADLAYVSAFRRHSSPVDFEIVVEYVAAPDIENRVLIVTDPMIATGRSIVQTIDQLTAEKSPSELHIVGVIASQTGLEVVQEALPHAKIWIGTVDPQLDSHGYIVPGLGDAGDLSFGEKEDR